MRKTIVTVALIGSAASTRLRVQNVIHYSFGALSGAAYGALAEAFPAATVGAGTVAGAGLYAASHGSALPLLVH